MLSVHSYLHADNQCVGPLTLFCLIPSLLIPSKLFLPFGVFYVPKIGRTEPIIGARHRIGQNLDWHIIVAPLATGKLRTWLWYFIIMDPAQSPVERVETTYSLCLFCLLYQSLLPVRQLPTSIWEHQSPPKALSNLPSTLLASTIRPVHRIFN